MRNRLIDNPTTMLEEDLNDLFKSKKTSDFNSFLSIVNLFLLKSEKNTDFIDLIELIGIENFSKIIHLLGGRTIKFPTAKELSDIMILAISYYFRKIEGITDWDEIQSWFGDYKIDRLPTALKIHNLDEYVSMMIKKTLGESKNE